MHIACILCEDDCLFTQTNAEITNVPGIGMFGDLNGGSEASAAVSDRGQYGIYVRNTHNIE